MAPRSTRNTFGRRAVAVPMLTLRLGRCRNRSRIPRPPYYPLDFRPARAPSLLFGARPFPVHEGVQGAPMVNSRFGSGSIPSSGKKLCKQDSRNDQGSSDQVKRCGRLALDHADDDHDHRGEVGVDGGDGHADSADAPVPGEEREGRRSRAEIQYAEHRTPIEFISHFGDAQSDQDRKGRQQCEPADHDGDRGDAELGDSGQPALRTDRVPGEEHDRRQDEEFAAARLPASRGLATQRGHDSPGHRDHCTKQDGQAEPRPEDHARHERGDNRRRRRDNRGGHRTGMLDAEGQEHGRDRDSGRTEHQRRPPGDASQRPPPGLNRVSRHQEEGCREQPAGGDEIGVPALEQRVGDQKMGGPHGGPERQSEIARDLLLCRWVLRGCHPLLVRVSLAWRRMQCRCGRETRQVACGLNRPPRESRSCLSPGDGAVGSRVKTICGGALPCLQGRNCAIGFPLARIRDRSSRWIPAFTGMTKCGPRYDFGHFFESRNQARTID